MKSFCFFLFILFQGTLLAQDTTAYDYVHEAGLDINFINVFIPLENVTIGRRGSYQFYYRKYRPGKKVLRMGLDIDFEGVFDRNQLVADRNNNQFALFYRVGWGKQRPIFDKALLFYGADLLLEPFYSSTRVGESADGRDDGNFRATYRLTTGGGPFVGLQYNLTPRLGLFTELRYYLRVGYELEDISFDEGAFQADATDRRFFYRESLRLPTSVALFFKF